MNNIFKKAQEYIEQGLSVIALAPKAKNPMANDWSHLDNNTVASLHEDFKSCPDANIGIRLGEFSKIGAYYLYVADLDISSDKAEDIIEAYETLEKFIKNHNVLPCVRSSSKNSRHFYFMSMVLLKNKKLAHSKHKVTVKVNGVDKEKNAWEIDVMSTGKQVVLPPSVFNGNTYQWERDLLEYLKDDSKKATMIINDVSHFYVADEKKVEIAEVREIKLHQIAEALDVLPEEYLDTYDKWLSIGMALHFEYADTDDEPEALALYESWSKKGSKYEKGATFKKWKSFSKKADGITLGTLLQHYKPKKEEKIDRIAEFSKFINKGNINLESLKQILIDLSITDIELEIFMSQLANSLAETYATTFTAVQTRRTIAGLRKESKKEQLEKEEQLAIGLDDTLSKMIIDKYFTIKQKVKNEKGEEVIKKGLLLLNQNGTVFNYKEGIWRQTETAVLSQIIYNAISEIVLSKDKDNMMIKNVLVRNKKLNDLNSLTNNIRENIMKQVTTSVYDDILNLQHKKEFSYSVVNTMNKEIYIEKGELTVIDHSYDSYLLSKMNVEYDPNADCPRFKKVILDYFRNLPDQKEVARHLLECMGLAIQSVKKLDPTFMLWLGGGENGKSLLAKVLTSILGLDSCLSVSINDHFKSPHANAGLMGKLVLLDDDYKDGAVLDDAMIKKTSETVAITANPKFKAEITFMSSIMSIILANNPPIVTDTSHGLARRANVFPFTHMITAEEKDTKLYEKLMTEKSGILNLLINSYITLEKRGHFDEPLSCRNAKNAWLKSTNSLLGFVSDVLVVTKDVVNDKIKGQNLYNNYLNYITDTGNKPLSRQRFYEKMAQVKDILRMTSPSDKNEYFHGVRFLKDTKQADENNGVNTPKK